MAKKKSGKLSKTIKKVSKTKVSIGSIILMFAIVIGVSAFVLPSISNEPTEQMVVTESTLEDVVKTSSLSTYETVYNGVSTVMNSKKKEKIDYYVAYEATVKAGLDFNKISIDKDDENKTVFITLPPIDLQKPIVSMETLDFIIVNKWIDENGLVADAYKICINDVTNEASSQKAIYEYAKKNAENLIKGLISPFVNQLDGYSIQFKEGE